MSLTLGFHYHTPAYVSDGQILIEGPVGRFVDSLAGECDQLVCFLHSPRPGTEDRLTYAIGANNVSIVGLGVHCSVVRRELAVKQYVRTFTANSDDLDALIIRGPSPLLPAVVRSVGLLPTVLLLVGSYIDGIDDLPQPLWRKELIRIWCRYNAQRQIGAVNRSLTFVNSRKLYEEMVGWAPNLIETRTSTLCENDFFIRADTCGATRCKLLFTGRIDRGKGLFEILEATSVLVGQGHDIEISFVGWPERGDEKVVRELKERANTLGIGERYFYHGGKALGADLFRYYREADIYVTASRLSEGFPRTIWEAMASSLPVVATSVGSIRQFAGDAVELAEPGCSVSLSVAIGKVIASPRRRREMIAKGQALARGNTAERRAKEMVMSIKDYICDTEKKANNV